MDGISKIYKIISRFAEKKSYFANLEFITVQFIGNS